MRPQKKAFFQLTAGDLMTRDVITVPSDVPLATAARLLAHSGISGAPVVDRGGHLVGVLSSSDFMDWMKEPVHEVATETRPCECVCSDWQMFGSNDLPADAVCRRMTCDPVTVSLDTPIREMARMMMEAHIHRLVVVDENRHPIGVVSSTDVLAALATSDTLP